MPKLDDKGYKKSQVRRLQEKLKSTKIVSKKNKIGKPYLEFSQGIFSRKTRKRLLGMSGISGRDRTIDDFWYDVRKQVKLALIDLQLFITVAERKNLNKVINRESLKPIIETLLGHSIVAKDPPEVYLAEISQMLAEMGLSYLRQIFIGTEFDTPMLQKAMDDAISTNKLLVCAVEPLREKVIDERKNIKKIVSKPPWDKLKDEV